MAKLPSGKRLLARLEDVFASSDYVLRYEKGSFQSGYCLLNDTKIAIVNKYYPVDGKVSCLIDMLRKLDLDTSKMTPSEVGLYRNVQQAKLEL